METDMPELASINAKTPAPLMSGHGSSSEHGNIPSTLPRSGTTSQPPNDKPPKATEEAVTVPCNDIATIKELTSYLRALLQTTQTQDQQTSDQYESWTNNCLVSSVAAFATGKHAEDNWFYGEMASSPSAADSMDHKSRRELHEVTRCMMQAKLEELDKGEGCEGWTEEQKGAVLASIEEVIALSGRMLDRDESTGSFGTVLEDHEMV